MDGGLSQKCSSPNLGSLSNSLKLGASASVVSPKQLDEEMKDEVDFDNSQPLFKNLKSNQNIHKEVFLDFNAPVSPGRDPQLSPGAYSLSGKCFLNLCTHLYNFAFKGCASFYIYMWQLFS